MSVWDDLVGQDAAVAQLEQAAEDAHTGGPGMTHAWLITGPPGSGRSVAARAFAAALECEDGGCGVCHACTTVMAGSHADVTVLATDKVTIGIDEARELVGRAQRGPGTGDWRVMVVEDADRMVERTSNVLLKAIEEPPERTVWILCAPSPQDVIVTIRSRCRAVRLRVPPAQAVADLLVRRDGVEPDLALQCARAAQSHVGLARALARTPEARARREAVLDLPGRIGSVGEAVLVAGELVEVAQDQAKAVAEQRDAVERAALLRALGIENEREKLPPALRSQLRQFDEDAKRRATRVQRDVLDRSLVDLMSYYRDVLVLQSGGGVELVNAERRGQLEAIAASTSTSRTTAKLAAIAQARRRLARNAAPLLAMEAMSVALMDGGGAPAGGTR